MSQYIGNDPQGNLPVRNIIATNKNYIINPTFIINQRAFAGGALVNSYGWDGWRGNNDGNMTLSGDTISIVTGKLRHVVEDFGYSGQATLSWEGDSLCAIGQLVDGQETISTPTSSPITFTYPASTSGTEVQFNFQGDGTSFSKPKLEIGTTQTPFEYPTFADEFSKCLRYFERIGVTTNSVEFASGYAASSTATRMTSHFTPKRTIPSCSVSSPSGLTVQPYGTAQAVTSITFGALGIQAMRVQANVASGLTGAIPCSLVINPGEYVDLSAEL